jgi:hypothetical protein
MQILFKRGQRETPLGHIKFDLWAKYEVSEEEAALLRRYHEGAVLSEGNMRRDLRRAVLYAILIDLVLVGIIVKFGNASPPTWVMLFIGLLGLGTFTIYQTIRETIYVSDILHGRTFACRNICLLIAKENTLLEMGHTFRHFLETMKTWGGVDIIEVEPDRPPILRLTEPQHAAAD